MSRIILTNEASTPGSVGSGKTQLYATSDGKIHQQTGTSSTAIATVSKYSTGWLTTFGGVSAASGSTHTITHNLGTTDITVSVWTAEDSSGTNPKRVEAIYSHATKSYGAFILDNDANSLVLQLGKDGHNTMSSGGYMSDAAGSPGWSEAGDTQYLKVLVMG
tara:strand:+ start:467 stop:952 length:486 start_codon:yes stop_codon:yes gene_type:complete